MTLIALCIAALALVISICSRVSAPAPVDRHKEQMAWHDTGYAAGRNGTYHCPYEDESEAAIWFFNGLCNYHDDLARKDRTKQAA